MSQFPPQQLMECNTDSTEPPSVFSRNIMHGSDELYIYDGSISAVITRNYNSHTVYAASQSLTSRYHQLKAQFDLFVGMQTGLFWGK